MRFINYLFACFLIFVLSFCGEPKSADVPYKNNDSAKVGSNDTVIKPIEKKDSSIQTTISQYELPKNISFKGKEFHSAYKWYDKTGWNILVLSTSSTTINGSETVEPEHSVELFARQYNLKDPGKPTVTWDMYDAQLKCIFDITCQFMNTDFTDLDNDSIKETFLLYKLTCRSDVSPATMKLIVHEEKKKYALRGKMIFTIPDIPDTLFPETRQIDLSKISKEEFEKVVYRDWGCYENENDFKNAPPSFLAYAKQLWRQSSFEQ